MDFTLRTSGGGFLTGAALQTAIEASCGPALVEAGYILATAVRAATPVKTGALRNDWHVPDKPEWAGASYEITIWNERIYAPIVQTRGRSAGYADRGLAAGKDAAVAAIKVGGAALTGRIWDKRS